MDSPITKLLVAGLVGTVGAAALYFMVSKSSSKQHKSSSKKKKRNKSSSKSTGGDSVSLETAIQIFTTIHQQMMGIMQSMIMYEQQIRQKAAGQVTEDELRDHINGTFVQELTKIERKVYEQFKCAESQVQAAVKKYNKDPTLKSKIEQLKKLFDLVRNGTDGATKPSEMKLPEGLDRNKAFDILNKVMNSIIASIDKVGKEMAGDGGKLAPAQIAEFNQKFLLETEANAERISKEYDITPQVSIFSCFFFFSFLLFFGVQSKRCLVVNFNLQCECNYFRMPRSKR